MLYEFGTHSRTYALGLSDDSTLIACTLNYSVEIWDTKSGTRLQKIVMDVLYPNYSFSLTKPIAPTELALDLTIDSGFQQCRYMGVGVSLGKTWITYKGKRVIAIPLSHRGHELCVNERTVGVGCWSGKVLTATINPERGSMEDI